MADDSEQILYTITLVIDAAVQRDLSRALFLAMFRGPFIWILLAALALIVAGTSLQGGVPAPAIILWLVLIAFVIATRAFRVRRAIRASHPIGRQLSTGFGSAHFVISDGDNSSRIAYSGFDQIEVGRGVVWIRRSAPRRRLAYPRALFPEAELDRLRSAIGASPVS